MPGLGDPFEPGVAPFVPPNPANAIAQAFQQYYENNQQTKINALNAQLIQQNILGAKTQGALNGVRPGVAPPGGPGPGPAAYTPSGPLDSRVPPPQFSFGQQSTATAPTGGYGAPSSVMPRTPGGAPPSTPLPMPGRMVGTQQPMGGMPSMIPPAQGGAMTPGGQYVQLDPSHYLDTSQSPFAHQMALQTMERQLMYQQMIENRDLWNQGRGYDTALRGYQARKTAATNAGVAFNEPPPDPRDYSTADGGTAGVLAGTPNGSPPATPGSMPVPTVPFASPLAPPPAGAPAAPTSVLAAKTQAQIDRDKARAANQAALETQRQGNRLELKKTPGAPGGAGARNDPGFIQLHQQVTATNAQVNATRQQYNAAQAGLSPDKMYQDITGGETPQQFQARKLAAQSNALALKQRLDSLTNVNDQLNQRLQNYSGTTGESVSADPAQQRGRPTPHQATGPLTMKQASSGNGGSTSSAQGAPHGAAPNPEDTMYQSAVQKITQQFTDPAQRAQHIAAAAAIYTKRTGRKPPE